MTTTTRLDARQCGLATLAFSRKVLLQLADGIPADECTTQPCAGGNHLIWVLGHLTWTDDYFMQALGGRDSLIPANWNELFGMGSKPVEDADNYPTLDDVRSMCERVRESLLGWFDGMSAEQLQEPLPDNLRGFAENHAILIGTLATHESMHAGQLTVVRKHLGFDPLMG